MSYPRFSVGEDVLIYSADCPEFDGHKAVIVSAEFYEMAYSPLTDKDYGDMWIYWITPCPRKLTPVEGEGWGEDELRKRPSDLSFDKLINSFKTKQPA